MRFRRKPEVVDAVRCTGDNLDELVEFLGGSRQVKVERAMLPGPGRGMHVGIVIRTLVGDPVQASVDDWIIRDENGAVRACRPPVFAAKYESVEE